MRTSHITAQGRYGSPNYVPTMLFNMLRRLQNGPNALIGGRKSAYDSEEQIIQDAMAAVFIGVNVVEAFMNIYFKVHAEENSTFTWYTTIISDLSKNSFGLGAKMIKWPKLCFGQVLDNKDPRYVEFEALKSLRNGLTHFKTSHTIIAPIPGVTIQGLSDLSLVGHLDADMPGRAVSAVIGFVELILEAHGFSPEQVSMASRSWIGFS